MDVSQKPSGSFGTWAELHISPQPQTATYSHVRIMHPRSVDANNIKEQNMCFEFTVKSCPSFCILYCHFTRGLGMMTSGCHKTLCAKSCTYLIFPCSNLCTWAVTNLQRLETSLRLGWFRIETRSYDIKCQGLWLVAEVIDPLQSLTKIHINHQEERKTQRLVKMSMVLSIVLQVPWVQVLYIDI